MTVRKIDIHDRETQYDHEKVEDAKSGGASAAPRGSTREPKINGVEQEDKQSDDIFRFVIPILTGQAIHPNEAEHGADGDRNEADENARLTHALEKLQRGQPPDYVANFAVPQQAILHQKDQA